MERKKYAKTAITVYLKILWYIKSFSNFLVASGSVDRGSLRRYTRSPAQ